VAHVDDNTKSVMKALNNTFGQEKELTPLSLAGPTLEFSLHEKDELEGDRSWEIDPGR